jgi:hypothetical protein
LARVALCARWEPSRECRVGVARMAHAHDHPGELGVGGHHTLAPWALSTSGINSPLIPPWSCDRVEGGRLRTIRRELGRAHPAASTVAVCA